MPQAKTALKRPPKLANAKSTTGAKPVALEQVNGTEDKDPKVLDLTALIPSRRLVKLPTKRHPEGENFELRLVEDFGIEMQQKLLAWSRKYQELMQAEDELDDEGTTRLRFLFDNLFNHVIDAPDIAKRGMDDSAKNRAITAFSWAPVLAQQELQMAVIDRLVDREMVTRDQVDEIMQEMREEALKLTMEN